jgi:hypothetical protein
VSPLDFVVEMGCGGKERAITSAEKQGWIKPYQTYCAQTRGPAGTLFFVFKTMQDGLLAVRDMLKARKYRLGDRDVPVQQVLEHQWGDDRLSQVIVDCELLTSQYSGRRSQAQIQAILHAFPEWFTRRLLSVRAVDVGCRLECVMKDKTRDVDGGKDRKNSAHFIFNLAGVPRHSHRQVCQQVCEPWRNSLSELFKTKNLDHVPDSDLDSPAYFLDLRAMHGSQGFSTLGGGKKPTDPPPVLTFKYLIAVSSKDKIQVSTQDIRARMEDELNVFHISSYTTARASTVAYSRSFQAKREVTTMYSKRFSQTASGS